MSAKEEQTFKACPFCENQEEGFGILKITSRFHPKKGQRQVVCRNCYAVGPARPDEAESENGAIAGWNERPGNLGISIFDPARIHRKETT